MLLPRMIDDMFKLTIDQVFNFKPKQKTVVIDKSKERQLVKNVQIQ